MIYRPTHETEDWKSLLADPEKQWKTGYSARTLAHCWEDAQGLPKSVRDALSGTNGPFQDVQPLLIFPEHRVSLPGGKAPSQCDVWVLAKDGRELISIAIEGKVSEEFGPSLEQWMKKESPGKRKSSRN